MASQDTKRFFADSPAVGISKTNLHERQVELTNWALAYAANGHPVFPVKPNKRPLVKWKHGASTDNRTIESWWQRWPNAMIGMPTGAPSGVVVLDFDKKTDGNGFDSWAALGEPRPQGVVEVRTPSGGAHFFYEYDPDNPIRNSAGKVGPFIDVRGDGGFIVLPPSRRLDGGQYTFVGEQALEIGRLL